MVDAKHIAAETTAALSLICWSLVPIPQIWKNWRAKTTEGLSPFLCIIWTFNGILIAAYAIATGLSAFLIAQPFVSAFFLMGCLWQIYYYDHCGRNWRKPSLWVGGIVLANVGALLGLIFGLRAALNSNVSLDFIAYISTAVGLGGMIPQYIETWRFQRVLGLSLGLCLLDMCGSLFGAASVLISTLPDLAVATFVLYIVYAPFVGGMIPLYYFLEARWRRLHPEGDVESGQAPAESEETVVELGDKEIAADKKNDGSVSEERTLASVEAEIAVEVAAAGTNLTTDAGLAPPANPSN